MDGKSRLRHHVSERQLGGHQPDGHALPLSARLENESSLKVLDGQATSGDESPPNLAWTAGDSADVARRSREGVDSAFAQ